MNNTRNNINEMNTSHFLKEKHDYNKEHNHDEEQGHGSYKSYFIGFILSIILTLASYMAVRSHFTSPSKVYLIIAGLAFVQLLVQLVFFLHITEGKKPRLNLLSFIFTIVITAILVGGSLWVMYNLNYNMM